MKYAIIILSLALISSIAYSMNIEKDPWIILEQENRQKIISCLENVYTKTWSNDMKKQIKFCESLPLLTIWTHSTGSTVPPQWYSKKHTLILTWSHDYRQYAHLYPWTAWWKNNNPSWLTWWVSDTLKWLWDKSEIDYKKGTARPAREKWNYIFFWTIEHGIRAKMISIRERRGNATVWHFLSGWWSGSIKLSFSTEKSIQYLSEQEFMELFIQQLKKESPWIISRLVEDKILIIQ